MISVLLDQGLAPRAAALLVERGIDATQTMIFMYTLRSRGKVTPR